MRKIFTLLFILTVSLLFSSNTFANQSNKLTCPTVNISFPGSPYCSSNSSPQPVTLTGTGTFTGGVFTSFPGLDINMVTGAITPSTSTAGTYTVSYYIPSDGTCPAVVANATVTILPSQSISLTSANSTINQTVCLNTAITNITYAVNNATGASVTGLPAGVTGTYAAGTFTISGVATSPGAYNYTVYTIGGACFPAVTAVGTIIVPPTPIATIGYNQTICSGNSAVLTFTGTPNAIVSYNINGGSNQNITLNSSGNATLTTAPLTSNTVYNLVNASSTIGCSSSISGSAVITVMPSPVMTTTPNSQTICSGDLAIITMTGSTSGTTFQWNVVQVGVIGASAGSGNLINQVLVTTGNNIGQAVYTITPTANGCAGSPMTITVTVMPIPIITTTPSNETINSGQATNIILSSSVAGTTYSWTSTSSNVTGASAGSGNTISQILTLNNTSLSGLVTYTVTPNKNGCYGNPIDVVVTVNPNLGTNDFNSQNFIVSPNPVTDILNIKNDQTINKVNVFNQLGQVVLQKEYNTNEVKLDFSGLKTGIYFIAVDSDKKQSTFKIVKN